MSARTCEFESHPMHFNWVSNLKPNFVQIPYLLGRIPRPLRYARASLKPFVVYSMKTLTLVP